jgi:hypothetical protein
MCVWQGMEKEGGREGGRVDKEEGSGVAPIPAFICSPEILGNMNIQLLRDTKRHIRTAPIQYTLVLHAFHVVSVPPHCVSIRENRS